MAVDVSAGYAVEIKIRMIRHIYDGLSVRLGSVADCESAAAQKPERCSNRQIAGIPLFAVRADARKKSGRLVAVVKLDIPYSERKSARSAV